MAKTKLIFDATEAVDNVGAWVRAGTDGDRIGSQNAVSQEWLNVASMLFDETGTAISSSNPLSVQVENTLGIDVDLVHTEDSVRLGDGTNFLTSTTVGTDIGLDVNIINASVVVSATDLDIRNLTFATDSVDVSGSSVSIAGSVSVTQGTSPWVVGDGGGSLTVDAVDLDIRNLDASIDSVSSWLKDGSGNSIGSSGGSLLVSDIANTAASFTSVNVDNTAGGTDLATELSNRKYLHLYNNSNKTVYVGLSGVTAATGFPLDPGSYHLFRAGAALNLFAIGTSGSGDNIRVAQLA